MWPLSSGCRLFVGLLKPHCSNVTLPEKGKDRNVLQEVWQTCLHTDASYSPVYLQKTAPHADEWFKDHKRWTPDWTSDMCCRLTAALRLATSCLLPVQVFEEKNVFGQCGGLALWSPFFLCFVCQHKGSIKLVFTNNTDMAKGNSYCSHYCDGQLVYCQTIGLSDYG